MAGEACGKGRWIRLSLAHALRQAGLGTLTAQKNVRHELRLVRCEPSTKNAAQTIEAEQGATQGGSAEEAHGVFPLWSLHSTRLLARRQVEGKE